MAVAFAACSSSFYVLPWFVDYLIRVYAWIVLLSDNSIVNGWLSDLGMKGDPPVQIPSGT